MNVELIQPNAILALLAADPAGRAPVAGSLKRVCRQVVERLREEARYLTALRQLRRLDDRDLDDIGVARMELPALARRHARGLTAQA